MSNSQVLSQIFEFRQIVAALSLKTNTITKDEYIELTNSLKARLDKFEKEVKQNTEN